MANGSITVPLLAAAPPAMRSVRLVAIVAQHTAEAGEILADRTGNNIAARIFPIEIEVAEHNAHHIRLIGRCNSLDALGGVAHGVELGDGSIELALPGTRADIVVIEVVNGASRPEAVDQGGALERPQGLGNRVATAAGVGKGGGKVVPPTAGHGEQLARRRPGVGMAEAVRGAGPLSREIAAVVMVHVEIGEIVRIAEDGIGQVGEPGERSAGKVVFGIGGFGTIVDEVGEVAGVDDIVDLILKIAVGNSLHHRLQNLLAKGGDISRPGIALPVERKNVSLGHAAPMPPVVGDGLRGPTVLVHHQQNVFGPATGVGGARSDHKQAQDEPENGG